jgi:hypothetical protein
MAYVPTPTYGGAPSAKSPNQTIRLESQDVALRLKGGFYTVDGSFHFVNTGDKTITEWVGFPMRYGRGFRRFEALVEGREVTLSKEPSRVGRYLTSLWGFVTRQARDDFRWLATHVRFPGNARTTVRASYDAQYEGRRFDGAFYIYGTSSFWKDSIGKATFTIDGSELSEIKGLRAEFSDSKKHVFKESKVSDNVVRYEITDFKPDRNGQLSVSYERPLPPPRDDVTNPGRSLSLELSWAGKTMTGKVAAFSPQKLLVKPSEGPEAAEKKAIHFKTVGKTKYKEFHKPEVGEKVEVDYEEKDGENIAYFVRVIR